MSYSIVFNLYKLILEIKTKYARYVPMWWNDKSDGVFFDNGDLIIDIIYSYYTQ